MEKVARKQWVKKALLTSGKILASFSLLVLIYIYIYWFANNVFAKWKRNS